MNEETSLEEGTTYDLRPKSFDDYIGQKAVVDTIVIAVTAAKKRGDPLDHSLFHGLLMPLRVRDDKSVIGAPNPEKGRDTGISIVTMFSEGGISRYRSGRPFLYLRNPSPVESILKASRKRNARIAP